MEENKRKPLKKIIIISVIAVLAIAFGVTSYVFSPDQRARRVLAVGEEYLEGPDYDQAFGKFKETIDIAPSNVEIRETIRVHIENLLTATGEARDKSDYDGAVELYDIVIDHGGDFDEELVKKAEDAKADTEREKTKKDLLSQADKDFTDGKYEDAQKNYDEAVNLGATDEEVNPNRDMCGIYQKIMELCAKKDWEGLGKLIDSSDFDPVVNELQRSAITIGESGDIRIVTSDGTVVLISGTLSEDGSGTAVALISAANTYSLYEGEWKALKPDGKGKLRVWNKNEKLSDAVSLTGTFAAGLSNGETAYIGVEIKDVKLSVSKGSIAVIKVDDKGRVHVAEGENGISYAAVGETEKSDSVSSYTAGVPGFGGGDKKLMLEMVDAIPPVLECKLSLSVYEPYIGWNGKKTYWPEGKEYERERIIGYGITATDNVDGDLTSKIEYVSKRKTDINGYNEDHFRYLLCVTYRVSDSAGNTSTMLVEYQFQFTCGDYWNVMSVTYPEDQ